MTPESPDRPRKRPRFLGSVEALERRQLLHGELGMGQHIDPLTPAEIRAVRQADPPGQRVHALALRRRRDLAAEQSPAVVGAWTPPVKFRPPGAQGAFLAIHLNLLPDGTVLAWPHNYAYFESQGRAAQGTPYILRWDPATNQYQSMNLPRTNLFCSGHAFLPDGRLIVVGGHGTSAYGDTGGPQRYGHASVEIYDWKTNTWAPSQKMDEGRYYASAISLGTGEVLAVSGKTQYGNTNTAIEIWKDGQGWRTLAGASTRGYPDWYPHIYQLSNGMVFAANPGAKTFYINPNGDGALFPGPSMNYPRRYYGTSVMYDQDKILSIGGNASPATAGSGTNRLITATAETIDLAQPNPTWRYTGSMSTPRWLENATILPDGKVLVTGGTREQSNKQGNALRGAVYSAEMWDPATGQWTLMASMNVPRMYHSTAMLLPDGRVIVSGGGEPELTGEKKNTIHDDMQIFSPPYLFRGPRPTIASAPDRASYGQAITVASPDAASIAAINLIRLGSVTHGFNMNQRIVHVPFVRAGGNDLALKVPSNPNAAPPGYYMMFLLNAQGVPSVAKMIQIGS